MPATQPIVTVTRDGLVESAHHVDVVVADPDGRPTVLAGNHDRVIYPRSCLKPFQAQAVLDMLADVGTDVEPESLAIICASHDGSDDAQVAAAAVLAEAGLDESSLQCPPAWPMAPAVLAELDAPTSLSHNCSGKHAGMLWAHTAAGHDAANYLDPRSVLQSRIARQVASALGGAPGGPGVDGCGAPAWTATVTGLATAYARLAAGTTTGLARARQAMAEHPELIGGVTLPDTALMLADARVVAKRGAEGVMGCGFTHHRHGPLGIAVKVHDGGDRASGPAAAAVLEALGAVVADQVRRIPVLGGGQAHGEVAANPGLSLATTSAFGPV